MLNGSFQIESMLMGALLATLPLIAGMLLQRRTVRETMAALEGRVQQLQQAAATEADHAREERMRHEQRVEALSAEHARQQEEWLRQHKEELDALQATHAKTIEEARSELSIVSFPYEFTSGDNGWIVDDRVAEVGYQYQLFVRGVPCFDPHKVVTQRIEKKEVNQEKVTRLKNEVLGLLETIASRHPAFQVAKKFVQVGK